MSTIAKLTPILDDSDVNLYVAIGGPIDFCFGFASGFDALALGGMSKLRCSLAGSNFPNEL